MNLCEKLVSLYLPEGTKVIWRKDGKWHPAWADQLDNGRYIVKAPYPDTPFKALVFLHECAHIASGAFRHDQPRHIEEYNAEMTAMGWYRQNGGNVPRAYLVEAKRYVRECIKYDRKKRLGIVPRIAIWAKR